MIELNKSMEQQIIGYSGLDLFEECYEYFENECYIADTPEAAVDLMKNSFMCMGEYRIDPITIEQIMDDYGCSCGKYAMEPKAFARFSAIAKQKNIRFKARAEDGNIPLMIVNVEGVRISHD
jgi:hypothetical protein